eukprot:g1747.t1
MMGGEMLELLDNENVGKILDASVQRVGKDLGGFCFPERNGGGVYAADYNNDGYVDLLITRLHDPPVMLRNRGPPTYEFEDVTFEVGLDSSSDEDCRYGSNGAAFFDADNDGDLDLYITHVGTPRFCLWIQDEHGHFTEQAIGRNATGSLQSDSSLVSGSSVLPIDFDGDGWIDLYTSEWRFHFLAEPSETNTITRSNARLLRNRGHGIFEDVTTRAGLEMENIASQRLAKHRDEKRRLARRAATVTREYGVSMPDELRSKAKLDIPMVNVVPDGVFTFGSVFADFDDDGYPDLFVSGDFQTSVMFWNNGNGTFTEDTLGDVGLGLDENGMGVAVADVDGDMRLDLFVSGIYADHETGPSRDPTSPFGSRGNVLYRNMGNRVFQEVKDSGLEDGGWAWGSVFLDANNDADLELFLVNGFRVPETSYEDLFWNVSPNRFWVRHQERWTDCATRAGLDSTSEGRGTLVLDFNNDGKNDLVIANHNSVAVLYRNVGAESAHFLRVRVRECPNCRDSIGAVVYLKRGEVKVQMRLVGSSGGFLSQSEMIAHFGLGHDESSSFDLEIQWAFDATTNTRPVRHFKNVPIDVVLEVYKSKDTMRILRINNEKTEDIEETCSTNIMMEEEESSIVDDMLCEVCNYETTKRIPEIVRDVAKEMISKHQREYRSLDGSGNNRKYPLRGASFTPLRREFPSSYSDKISSPAGLNRVSARTISSEIFSAHSGGSSSSSSSSSNDEKRKLSELASHFGQLLAHDLSHTTPQPNVSPKENFPILDGEDNVLRFRRSTYTTAGAAAVLFGSGDDESSEQMSLVREQINKVTSFVDLSVLYGSDSRRAHALRANHLGMMRSHIVRDVSSGKMVEYPPLNVNPNVPNDDPLGRGQDHLFACGDVRANIQPGLLAMHTLWLREHNFIARALIRTLALEMDLPDSECAWCEMDVLERISSNLGITNTSVFDELLFQETRRILIAEFQHVTYNEYLPALFGRTLFSDDDVVYDEHVHASVSNTFATAAMRFGHTQVQNTIARVHANGTEMSKPLKLREAYFATSSDVIERFGGLDSMLRAMLTDTSIVSSDENLCDEDASRPCVSDDVREFLFGSDQRILRKDHKKRRRTGTDLIALNIQRGRDHGLPDYNFVLKSLGFTPLSTFTDMSTTSVSQQDTLSRLYKQDVDNIDLYVGLSLERKETLSHVGPLTGRILENQFRDLKSSDRFFYTNEFTEEQCNRMESMKSIMERNTAIGSMKIKEKNSLFFI